MKYNKILKLAYFYSYAISEVYDVVNVGRTIDTVCKLINNFLKENKEDYTNEEIVDFKLKIAEISQNKFNQLVAPYLQMKPVDIGLASLKQRLELDANQDDLQFFLHDLIHEILQEGSIKKFDKLDQEFAAGEREILKEMEESEKFKKDDRYWTEDEEGDKIFNPIGGAIYQSSNEVYTLEDFIEEQIAESLTNKKKITLNGVYKYIKILMIGLANKIFNFNWSQSEDFFEESSDDIKEIEYFLDKIIEKVSEDSEMVKNSEYKMKAKKFLHSLKNWIKDLKNKIFQEYEKNDQVNFSNIFTHILKNAKNWIGANFDTKERKFFSKPGDEFEHNPMGEKPYSKVTDDFKMSLLRRWVFAVEKEVLNMIDKEKFKPYKQLKFNF